MGKEIKIGLAVIGVLLCVFGGVLFFRLRRESPGAAQKNVAALKKGDKENDKAKSQSKKPVKPEKPDEERYDRFAEPTAWSAQSRSDTGPDLNVNRKQPPAADRSPYRDRSRGGRYEQQASSVNDGSTDATTEQTGQDDAGQEEAGHPDLAMPDGPSVQRPGDVASSDGDQLDETGGADEADDDGGDPMAEDRYADNRYNRQTVDPYAENRETGDRYARNRVTDRVRDGELAIENDTEEAAEPEEGTMRLSPLVEDDTEVRPAADDRYAERQYEQDRFRRDRFTQNEEPDHGERNGDESNHDELSRDGATPPEPEEMDDDRKSVVAEPVEEHPAQLRSQTDSYVVEPNDNFWRISQKVYGTGAYFKALEEHNRRQLGESRLINVGDVVSVPPLAVLRENYGDLCPKPRNVPAERETLLAASSVRRTGGTRTYTVAEGDTLFDIARHELGKASRWAEIYQINREQLGEDFNYLSPGMQLALPDQDNQAHPVASRPRRDGYQR